MQLTRKHFLALAPAALLLAACGGGDDGIDDQLDIADPQVRFVHAAQLAPSLTLYRNDVAQADATNVGYRFASNYFDVETGAAAWRVGTASGNAEIGTLQVDTRRGSKYTLLAVPGATVPEVLLVDDPYDKGFTSDRARVRVVNGSFTAQNIDVYVNAPGTNLATVQPNFAAVAYKQAVPPSGDDAAEIEGGTYQLRVTEAGTKNVLYDASVTLAKDADWLVTTVPSALAPDAIKLLVVQTGNPARTALEIESQ